MTSLLGSPRQGSATSAPAAAPARTAARWDTPVTSYYVVAGATFVLLALGLVMVLSSSTVYSLREGDSPVQGFLSQAVFAALALPLMIIASRMPPRLLRALAWPAMIVVTSLQLLLFTPMARGAGGNVAWVNIGGFTFQPSESAKVGLALWLGAVLATKQPLLRQWRHVIVPSLLGIGVILGVTIYSHDLGTALVLICLSAGALFVAGVPMRILAALALGVGSVVAYLAASGTRLDRINALLGLTELDPQGNGLQSRVALEALGTGGIGGVGLGESRTKWGYLPAGHNDFILAIIGEELGLLGTLLVLGLFGVLAAGMTRIVRRHPDPFAKITTGAIAAWLLSQALINIGVVIGVLPVIGLPLPFVSSGGSALVTSLVATGIVLAFARDEPGAREAFSARRGTMRRSLGVLTGRITRRSP